MALTSGEAMSLSLDNLKSMKLDFPSIFKELFFDIIDNLRADL